MIAYFKPVAAALSLEWLAGPIFTKELRVASRRKRTYLLRFAYLALLAAVVAIVWLNSVATLSSAGSSVIYRMSEAGKAITTTIAWFQFIAIQLVAVAATSTAISEEVYRGTINSLMTTPITSLQIVAGKILSKLWQMIILVAISMPMLGIVQVFGGMPWEYVISSSCMTLTAGLLAASGTMFFSVLFRRAWVTILLTLAAGFFLYSVLPLIIGLAFALMSFAMGSASMLGQGFIYANPFSAMVVNTIAMMEPNSMGGIGFFWPVHCLLMLGLSAGILSLCVLLVRRRALRNAMGGAPAGAATITFAQPLPMPPMIAVQPTGTAIAPPIRQAGMRSAELPNLPPLPQAKLPADTAGRIRDVKGSPVLWKELRAPLFRSKVLRIVAFSISAGLLVLLYMMILGLKALGEPGVQVAFVGVLTAIGTVCTAVIAATSISSEKESRSLPILLTTPLSDWHILLAKAAGVARRCAPVWAFLAGHLLLFVAVDVLNPLVLLCVPMIVIGTSVFLIGTGIFFGSALKNTTMAVLANLGLAITLWLVVPVILGIARVPMFWTPIVIVLILGCACIALTRSGPGKIIASVALLAVLVAAVIIAGDFHSYSRFDSIFLANPVFSAGEIADMARRWKVYRAYSAFIDGLQHSLVLMTTYGLAGAIFFLLAKRDFRRNVF